MQRGFSSRPRHEESERGEESESVPLLKLDGGHRNRACLGDSPRLYAGDHGNPVFYRHLVQDRAAGVVV